MAPKQNPTVICAEDISLLSLLHTVPARPQSNKPKNLPAPESYTLPFDEERSLTSTLAFLSSTKDGPTNIPAVCIIEEPNPRRLNAFLAVNKKSTNDGDGLLNKLTREFENIFRILRTSINNQCSSSETEDKVFTAIVSMCSQRILSRLRLATKARKNGGKTIKDNFLEVIEYTKRPTYNMINNSGLDRITTSFVLLAREIIALVDSWRNHQTSVQLKDLIKGIYRLHHMGVSETILDRISNKDMDSSAKARLANMIKKIARYRQAARILFRAAKRFPVVRNIQIIPVKLPQKAFEASFSGVYTPDLLAAISRIAPKYAKATNFDQIQQIMKINRAEFIAQFSQQTQKTLHDAKVHAEVQLIIHCQSQSPRKLPRVVCSSKDACYLCNAFIAMYGKVHTPRCHGRLYPGWRLPILPQMNDVQTRFNVQLENRVRQSLDTLFSRRQKTDYPCPNESTLLTLATSISTIARSIVLPSTLMHSVGARSDIHEIPNDGNSHDTSVALSSGSLTARSLDVEPGLSSSTADDTPPTDEIRPCARLTSEGSDSTSADEVNDHHLLSQGLALTRNLKASQKISPLYTTGPLEVQIEYDNESSSATTDTSKLHYNIEWLSVDDTKMLKEKCHSDCVIDVDTLEGEMLHTICNENNMYVVAQGTAIRLGFH